MAIFVCGDTHGRYDLHKLTTQAWKEQRELTENDFLIILGDTGILWSNDPFNKDDDNLIDWHSSSRYTTIILDGNHDNLPRWRQFPVVDFHNAKAHQLRKNVFHIERGEVFELENRTFFAMGGGFSIDKNRRIDGITWWKEEMPNFTEMKFGMDQLLAMNCKVDFILTHTCSHRSFNKIAEKFDMKHKIEGEESLRDFFEWIENNVDFDEWHFGHFHDDFELDEKHFLHYNNKPRRIV